MTFTPTKPSDRLTELADRLNALQGMAVTAKSLAHGCHITTEDALAEVVAELAALEKGVAAALGQAILLERRGGA